MPAKTGLISSEFLLLSFIKAKAHTQRQTRGRYGGSLPDFNLAQSQSARHVSKEGLCLFVWVLLWKLCAFVVDLACRIICFAGKSQ